MRIIFFGSGSFAIPVLEFLLKFRRKELLAVITQPDRRAGRRGCLRPTPVKNYLRERENFEVEIFQPEDVNQNSFIEKISSFNPELFLVASFGQIFGSRLLNLPSRMALNIHASLLPKYRGAAPVNWALINGEEVTGVTIFKMAEKMDAGEIIIQDSGKILPQDNAITLERRLSQLAVPLVKKVFEMIEKNSFKLYPQVGEASYAPKLRKKDGLIDWSQSAVCIWNRIRGLQPWPGSYTYFRGALFKIYSAKVVKHSEGRAGEIVDLGKESIIVKCGKSAIEIFEIQLEGKRKMSVREFLAGHKIEIGEILGA